MCHSESFEYLYVKIGPWVWPGRVPEKKKQEKKSHTRSIFRQNSPSHGGATGYSIGTKFGRVVVPLDLITPANFKLGRLRTGCVARHESLLSFRFSALHRLSPLTQLGPAGPLVIGLLSGTVPKVQRCSISGQPCRMSR